METIRLVAEICRSQVLAVGCTVGLCQHHCSSFYKSQVCEIEKGDCLLRCFILKKTLQ